MTQRVQQSWDRAKKVGHAIGRKVRAATGAISAGVGVGDDESEFGGRRNRAWIQVLEEARERLLQLFEKSYFERFPRLERLVRKFLGGSTKQLAPKVEAPKAKPTGPLGAHNGVSPEQAARFKAQIQRGIMEAHTRENVSARERANRKR